MADVSLRDEPSLSVDDPKVDDKIAAFLDKKIKELITAARESYAEAQQAAETFQETLVDGGDSGDSPETKYAISQPSLVLVRLRVEHTGFGTINNQRFGAKYVGSVANPSDVLLFHRKRAPVEGEGGKAKKKKRDVVEAVMEDPIEEVSVEDLIKVS